MAVTVQEERAYVLKSFQNSMEKYKGKRIALYGLGANTEHIVAHQKGSNIVALMDSAKEGESRWGVPVISKKQAVDCVDVIVIVSRRQSVPIIYERIADLEGQGIVIIDILGERVNLENIDAGISQNKYFDKNEDNLAAEIEKHEVLTVDVFDTLIMRKVLLPENIFQVTEKIWNERHSGENRTFSKVRVLAEKNANMKYIVPTYDQIYDELRKISSFSKEECEELKELEYETEMLFIVPRDVIAEAIERAWDTGKKVYLISDMYFSKDQIAGFLKKCGINHYDGMMVSCEAGCAKGPEGELFQQTMQKYHLEPRQILHIGDNPNADGESAEKCGIDTFLIWSAKQMLEDSYLRKILIHVKSPEDAIITGMYMAKVLNNPFALSKGRGRLLITSKKIMGFIGYGGMITAYLHWLLKKSSQDKIDKILFLARDGYLLERLYQRIVRERKIGEAPKGVYTLASRRCLAGAAIYNEGDLIAQIERMKKPNIPAGEFLKLRFGVNPKAEDRNAYEKLCDDELHSYLLSYGEEIIQESERERTNFLKYLHSLDIQYEREKNIIFDSATSGTCAYYYRRVTKTDTRLQAIVLVKIPEWSCYDLTLDEGFLGEDMANFERRGYTKCTLLNDSILISPNEQLVKINRDGNPVFVSDLREESFEKIRDVQEGIEEFCYDYIRLTPYAIEEQEPTAELVDCLVGLLISNTYVLNGDWKNDFAVVEQFSGEIGSVNIFDRIGVTSRSLQYEY